MIKIVENQEPPTEDVINLRNTGKSNEEIVSELTQKGFNSQQVSEAINQADIKGGVEGTIPSPPMPGGETPSAQPGETPTGPPTTEGGAALQSSPPLDQIAPMAGADPEMKPSALNQYQSGSEMPIPVPSPGGEVPIEQPKPALQQPSSQVFQQAPEMPTGSMDIESMQEIIESVIDERWQEVVASIGDISLWRSKIEDDISAIKQEVLRIDDRFAKLQASMIGRVDEYQKSISKVSNEMVALEQVFGKIMEPLTSNIKELQRITKTMQEKK